MYRQGFENIVIWVVLFVVFGPLLATTMTSSIDSVVAVLTPYVGFAGVALLVVLALRMLFR